MNESGSHSMLLSYLYGELSDVEALRVEEELASNEEAAKYLSEQASVLVLIRRALESTDVPPSLGLATLALQQVREEELSVGPAAGRSQVPVGALAKSLEGEPRSVPRIQQTHHRPSTPQRQTSGIQRGWTAFKGYRWRWVLGGTTVSATVMLLLLPALKNNPGRFSGSPYSQEAAGNVANKVAQEPSAVREDVEFSKELQPSEVQVSEGVRSPRVGSPSVSDMEDARPSEAPEVISARESAASLRGPSPSKEISDTISRRRGGKRQLHTGKDERVSVRRRAKKVRSSLRRFKADSVSSHPLESKSLPSSQSLSSEPRNLMEKAQDAQRRGKLLDALAYLRRVEVKEVRGDAQLLGTLWLTRAEVYVALRRYPEAIFWARRAENVDGFSGAKQAAAIRVRAERQNEAEHRPGGEPSPGL